MTWLDLAAGAVELLGKWVTGNKCRWGHAINFVCCVLWIAYVITTKSTYGLLLIVVPAMFINVRNFVKWSKEDNLKTAIMIRRDQVEDEFWVELCHELGIPEEDLDGATVLCIDAEDACVN
jgi:hypothetical protein